MKLILFSLLLLVTATVVSQPLYGPYPVPGSGGGAAGFTTNSIQRVLFTNLSVGQIVFTSITGGGTNEWIGTNNIMEALFAGPTNGAVFVPSLTISSNLYVLGQVSPSSVIWTLDSVNPRFFSVGADRVFVVEDVVDTLGIWYYTGGGVRTKALFTGNLDADNIVQGTVSDLNLNGNVITTLGGFGLAAFAPQKISAPIWATNLNGNFLAASNLAVLVPAGAHIGYVFTLTNETTGQGTWQTNNLSYPIGPAGLPADAVYTIGPLDAIGTQTFLHDIVHQTTVYLSPNAPLCFSNWALLPSSAGTVQNFIGFSNNTPYVINYLGTNLLLYANGNGASLTALNASQLTSGTVPLAALSALTTNNNIFTGTNSFQNPVSILGDNVNAVGRALMVGSNNAANNNNPAQIVGGEWQTSGTTRPFVVLPNRSSFFGIGAGSSGLTNLLRIGALSGAGYNTTWPTIGTIKFALLVDGDFYAQSFSGNGSGLTNIPIAGISSGLHLAVAVTVGASAFNFTNNTPDRLECFFSGAAAYSVSKNGVAVYGSLAGDAYFVLQPTNNCTITYLAATPTMFTNKW